MLDVNRHMLIKNIVKCDIFLRLDYIQLVRVVAWSLGCRKVESKEMEKEIQYCANWTSPYNCAMLYLAHNVIARFKPDNLT